MISYQQTEFDIYSRIFGWGEDYYVVYLARYLNMNMKWGVQPDTKFSSVNIDRGGVGYFIFEMSSKLPNSKLRSVTNNKTKQAFE